MQISVDHFADVLLHRRAHDDRDFTARKFVILLEPLCEARRCVAKCLVERAADSRRHEERRIFGAREADVLPRITSTENSTSSDVSSVS